MTFDRRPSSIPPIDSTRDPAPVSWRSGVPRLDGTDAVDDWGVTGIAFAPILRALAELGLPSLTDGEPSRATGSEAKGILDVAAATLGDEALGLHLAERVPVGAFGTPDYAFAASSGLRQALGRLVEYYPLLSERVTVVLREEPTCTVVALRRKAGTTQQSRHCVELTLGMVFTRIRHALGPAARLDGVRFCHAAPARTEERERFFGAPLRFSQDEDALLVPRAILDTPFRTAAPTLAAMLDGELATVLQAGSDASGGEEPVLGRVRSAIATALDCGDSNIQVVAARLQLSSRTLQRILHRRGTSHSMIVDDIRRERAIQLVTSERLTGAEAASRLGFSEPGAFFRAFRRWTGTSPVAFRRTRRADEQAGQL